MGKNYTTSSISNFGSNSAQLFRTYLICLLFQIGIIIKMFLITSFI